MAGARQTRSRERWRGFSHPSAREQEAPWTADDAHFYDELRAHHSPALPAFSVRGRRSTPPSWCTRPPSELVDQARASWQDQGQLPVCRLGRHAHVLIDTTRTLSRRGASQRGPADQLLDEAPGDDQAEQTHPPSSQGLGVDSALT